MDTSDLTAALAARLDIQHFSPLQPLDLQHLGWPNPANIKVYVKRDDLLHPVVSGNKWRKLSALLGALSTLPTHIVSFGGGYSNHLHALGYVCQRLRIRFTAIVRGHYQHHLTPTLQDIAAWGGELEFVDKLVYRQRNEPAYLAALQVRFGDALIIPEGGSAPAALAGMQQLVAELPAGITHLLCPVASGATLAGLAKAAPAGCQVQGIAVLKGRDYLQQLVTELAGPQTPSWHIEHAYHHGGYAKASPQLRQFCQTFNAHSQIPVEPVYSGKLFFALCEKITQSAFAAGSQVVALHTGGLQGARN